MHVYDYFKDLNKCFKIQLMPFIVSADKIDVYDTFGKMNILCIYLDIHTYTHLPLYQI